MKKVATYTDAGATLSRDEVYRYCLWRRWSEGDDWVLFVGLNPSTADAMLDDPTIRRMVGFAKREKFGGMAVVNLYAYRATDPEELRYVDDPIGTMNDRTLREWFSKANLIVICCGIHASQDRLNAVISKLVHSEDITKARCLGSTRTGIPRHPLYLKADTPLEPLNYR